ncbi:MAG: NUDIX domain-containing protein [Agathobacter sp.]|nr:NUDIX domain-containing protein [Agathobacter sp.]
MKTLLTLDEKNYTNDMKVFLKHCMRGVIIRDGKLAVQRGKAGEMKILGGGVEQGEDYKEALIREVREESGLVVIPESIREVGKVIEKRRDIFEPDMVYECHSYFFLCDAEETLVETHLTESEKKKGYELYWATPEEMIEANQAFFEQPWIVRDTKFVEMNRTIFL